MSIFWIFLSNRTFCFSSFLNGKDSTLLVYGQSGSGKSFTIGTQNLGPSTSSSSASPGQQSGILQSVLKTIFERMKEDLQAELQFTAVEYYLHQKNDLLLPRSTSAAQPSHQLGTPVTTRRPPFTAGPTTVTPRRPLCPAGPTSVTPRRPPFTPTGRTPASTRQPLAGFSATTVASVEEALLAVQRATNNRLTASTSKNSTSSRSHALFQLILKKGER